MSPRKIMTIAALLVLASGVAGCTNKKKDTPIGDLPAGTQLMADGDKAMSDVKSTHFLINVTGKVPDLPLKAAEGDLVKEGSAKGTAKIEQFGMVIEIAFVVIPPDLYYRGATGGTYTKVPLASASGIYDPSAILDPERGTAKLLRTAKNPKTEAKETVDGKDAYRVSFEPDPQPLKALVPGVPNGTTGMVWLDATTKRILKAEFKIPVEGGEPGIVNVTFTNYDVPVTISAP